jgi:hypothetical protein
VGCSPRPHYQKGIDLVNMIDKICFIQLRSPGEFAWQPRRRTETRRPTYSSVSCDPGHPYPAGSSELSDPPTPLMGSVSPTSTAFRVLLHIRRVPAPACGKTGPARSGRLIGKPARGTISRTATATPAGEPGRMLMRPQRGRFVAVIPWPHGRGCSSTPAF